MPHDITIDDINAAIAKFLDDNGVDLAATAEVHDTLDAAATHQVPHRQIDISDIYDAIGENDATLIADCVTKVLSGALWTDPDSGYTDAEIAASMAVSGLHGELIVDYSRAVAVAGDLITRAKAARN